MRNYNPILPIIIFLLCLPQWTTGQCLATNTPQFNACLAGGATSIEIPKRTPVPYIFAITDADLSGVSLELNNAVLVFLGDTQVDAGTRFYGEGNALILVIAADGSIFTAAGNSGNGANTSFSDLNDALASGSFSNLLNAIMGAAGVLPVELTTFTGRAMDTGVQLSWATATELNNDYFEVQHSRDGRSFATVETVAGHGTTYAPQSYTYLHRDPKNGLNYYRLRQVDYDGAFEIHPVIAVAVDGAGDPPITVFPNPATELLQVRWMGPGEGAADLRVFDLTGRELIRYRADKKNATYDLPLAELPAGMYLLHLQTEGVTETVRFEKM